jgi:hypothetical protein
MCYKSYDYKDPIHPTFWVPEAKSVQYGEKAFDGGDIWSHYLYKIVLWAPGNPRGSKSACARLSPESIQISYSTGSTPTPKS